MTINKDTNKTLKELEKISGHKFTLGKFLWSIRMGEEETQVSFSEQLGISRQYLCDLENGRRFSSPKAAAEYAKKLGYSEEQFVKLCLQDLVIREGIAAEIEVKFKKPKRIAYAH